MHGTLACCRARGVSSVSLARSSTTTKKSVFWIIAFESFVTNDRVFVRLWFLFMSPLLFSIGNSLFLRIASTYIGVTERTVPPLK